MFRLFSLIPFSIVSKWKMTEDYGLSPHNWARVTGKRDVQGDLTGIFGDTELLWHSNESGIYSFAPLVALYGAQHMSTSATGFCQMTDWFERQTQAFQSELKELVVQLAALFIMECMLMEMDQEEWIIAQ